MDNKEKNHPGAQYAIVLNGSYSIFPDGTKVTVINYKEGDLFCDCTSIDGFHLQTFIRSDLEFIEE